MQGKKFKWYSPFVLLAGTILSFADPVTDILTAVEFYRTDHKIWFSFGLFFVFLQTFVVSIFFCACSEGASFQVGGALFLPFVCVIFNPFRCFFLRVRELVYYFKEWWNRNQVVAYEDRINDADDSATDVVYAVLLESLCESAPQFILQLYVASVQEEPLKVIQIISLLVSFISLAWAFTSTDEMIYDEITYTWKVKHKLALFVTHLFLLSSRLLAVCFFTVSYKWWVIGVFLFHDLVIATVDTICDYLQQGDIRLGKGISSALLLPVHWLRDDLIVYYLFDDKEFKQHLLWKRQLFSYFLFISENFTIILLFYYSQKSNTWYSLPVTVCVCLFGVLGAAMRIILFRQFFSKTGVITNNNDDNGSASKPTSEADPRFGEGEFGELSTPSGSIHPRAPPPPPSSEILEFMFLET